MSEAKQSQQWTAAELAVSRKNHPPSIGRLMQRIGCSGRKFRPSKHAAHRYNAPEVKRGDSRGSLPTRPSARKRASQSEMTRTEISNRNSSNQCPVPAFFTRERTQPLASGTKRTGACPDVCAPSTGIQISPTTHHNRKKQHDRQAQ
jgi:hypothetical protein